MPAVLTRPGPSRSAWLAMSGTVVLLLALGLVPGARANGAGTLAADSTDLSIGVLDNGNGPAPCVYLHPAASGGSVASGDLRLTPCAGRPAGSIVTETASDVGRSAPAAPWTLSFADANANAAYDAGDGLYVGGPDPSGGATTTVRLTQVGQYAAGTVVASADGDAKGSNGALQALAGSFGFVDGDHAGDPYAADFQGNFDAQDAAYVLAGHGPGVPAGQAVPPFAVHVYGGGAAFGTLVADPSAPAPGTSTATSSSGPAPAPDEQGQGTGTDSSPPSTDQAPAANGSQSAANGSQSAANGTEAANATAGADAPPPTSNATRPAQDESPPDAADNATQADEPGAAQTETATLPADAAYGAGQGGADAQPASDPGTSWWLEEHKVPASLPAALAGLAMAALVAARRR